MSWNPSYSIDPGGASSAPPGPSYRDLEERLMRKPWSWRHLHGYGVVVLSVNVSVFAYAPVRSASVEAIGCLKLTVTGSLETGPFHVFSVVGLLEPPTLA